MDHARRVVAAALSPLRNRGVLYPDVIRGFMLADGVSAKGADRPAKLVESLTRR